MDDGGDDARLAFDEGFYLAQLDRPLPDGGSALDHYRQEGWRLGLDPHPLFSTRHYLAHAPDAPRSGLDPLTHFLGQGMDAARPFHPCFDIVRYRQQLADPTPDNPLLHYLREGAALGLAPCDIFDAGYYRDAAAASAAIEGDPLSHYLVAGWRLGLPFHPFFDPAHYMAQPGAGRHSPVPLVDFLLAPAGTRASPQALFDPAMARGLPAGFCPYHSYMIHGLDRPGTPLSRLRSDDWFRRAAAEGTGGSPARRYLAARRRYRDHGRRRIIFVGHEATRTGAPTILLRLVEHAAASGLVECVTVLAAGGPLVDAYAAAGHVLLPKPGDAEADTVRYVLDRFADDPPAAAVVNTIAIPKLAAALAAAGVPIHLLVHEPADMYPTEQLAAAVRNADRLIFGSRHTAGRFRARIPVEGRQVEVAYSGLTNPPGRDPATPPTLPTSTGELVVLGCGTMSWRKGIDRFVTVARKTLARLPVGHLVRFDWIGGRLPAGHEAADFWAAFEIALHGLGDRVRLVDEMADLGPAYAGAAVFLMTSRADPFPGVVLEAMSAGLPVIAFADSGGAPEALAGGAGIVVPYDDTDAMADALAALLAAPERRRALGEVARAKVAAEYRFADYAAAILNPIVPGLLADAMADAPIGALAPLPARAKGAEQPAAPARPSPLDPDRETLLIVADGADPDAGLLALNLASFLRRQRNIALLLCDGGALAPAARAAADAVVTAGAATMRDAALVRSEIDRIAVTFAVRRAIIIGEVPAAVPFALAARFLPCVLVPGRKLPAGSWRDTHAWSHLVVAPTPGIAASFREDQPERPDGEILHLQHGRSRIWSASGAGRTQETARLKAALEGTPDAQRPLLVLGAGAPTVDGGIDLFLRCAARLADDPRLRFAWVCDQGTADGPEWSALRRRIAGSQRHRQVVLWGEAPTLEPAFAAAAMFLATAAGDRVGFPALGALEHGLPVIAFTDGGGLAAMLAADADAAAGLVPEHDPAAAAALVARMAADDALRTRLADAARRLAQDFTPMGAFAVRLDRLARDRAADAANERADMATIAADPDFDLEEYLAPQGAPTTREIAAMTHVRAWRCGFGERRPAPGIHPGILAEMRPGRAGDPFAAYIRDGKPAGPWRHQVIGPGPGDGSAGTLRTALHLHLFHADQLDDILRRLAVNLRRADLVITTDSRAKAREIEWRAATLPARRLRILLVPNRGRDIGAFLTGLGPAMLAEYDVVGHLHSKKTEHQAAEVGRRWRERLMQGLVGDAYPMADRILAAFETDPSLGLVHPDDPNLLSWDQRARSGLSIAERSNRPWAETLSRRMGIGPLPEFFDFPVGTMFWARPRALQPLFDLGLRWEDYPPEPAPIDASILHAIERLIGVVAAHTGHRTAVTHLPGFAR